MHTHTRVFFFFCLILRFFYNEPEFLNDEFIYIDTNNNGNGKKKFAVHENETQFFKMSFKLVSRESFDLYCFIFVRHLFPLKAIFLFFFVHIYIYIYMDLMYNKALLFVYLFFSTDWIVLSFFVNFLFSGF